MTLNNAFDIASEGLQVTSQRIQAYTANVANAGTPYYVRKIPVISPSNAVTFQGVIADLQNNVFHTGLTNDATGVAFDGVVKDPTPGKKLYSPGHPQADKDGYITLSNVNVIADIADATVASHTYEANLAVIGVIKQMANRAIDIGRAQ